MIACPADAGLFLNTDDAGDTDKKLIDNAKTQDTKHFDLQ